MAEGTQHFRQSAKMSSLEFISLKNTQNTQNPVNVIYTFKG